MRKAANKQSKVIRVSTATLKTLEAITGDRIDTWDSLISEVLTWHSGPDFWVNPAHMYKSKNSARKNGLKEGASKGLDFEEIEQPVQVKRPCRD